ncbi:heat stress transcription factor A-7a-like [Forsythia ovata]|uniref:Heat stress transcription factor A-7a-like n=1 Tax=Forsythia ovata TaxID=205694 RepID=A0ABD1QAW2_9LAMI
MDLVGVGIESSGASGGRRSDTGGVWPSSSSPRSNSQRLKTCKGVREFGGFRKIGVEHQWEYENQYFQAGKEHLLIKIQRRNHNLETLNRQKRTRQPCIALINYEMELVLGHLRNSISESKLEFKNLKQKLEDVETQIVTFKQHIENAQNKSKNLLMLLAKALDEIFVNPVLMKERNLSNNETRKKPRMAAAQATTNYALQAFNVPVSSTGGSGTPIQDHKVDLNSEASVKESGEYKFWKELLEGDDAREEIVNIKQQAKIALELENLITKLPEHETKEVTLKL